VKCFYCDFTAFSGQKSATARYLSSLGREADLYRTREVSTVYIGGGTPTELSAAELTELFAVIRGRFGPMASMAEVTLEANPESTDAEKLDALKEAGVTRLSLALQTADDALLKSIGRRHTFKDFKDIYALCKEREFDLSVDLMYGLPGQSRTSSKDGVDAVLDLDPDHLSLYGLQVEDRTLFGKREVEVDEDLAREQFEDALSSIASAGFRHYEVSNFAKPGKASIHNLNYWHDGEYIGLGCGAAGYLDGERWQNYDRLKDYCEMAESGKRPLCESEALTGKEKIGETLMLRMRLLEGAPLDPNVQEMFREEIAHLLDRGLIEMSDAGCSSCETRSRLTKEGLFLANEVFREFVPPFQTQPAPVGGPR